MNRKRRLCLLLLLFSAGAGFANAPGQPQGEADPMTALRLAVDKFERAKDSKTGFTYLQLDHTQNFDEKGKKTVDYTQLFEVTYVADLEYLRLLEVDGKVLSGKTLAAEPARG